MNTPRPLWNDPEVQAAAVLSLMPEVEAWVRAMGAVDLEAENALTETRAVVTLAIQESADAYGAGRYLESILEWPVDAELIRIFDRVYAQMPQALKPFVHAWVMREKVRFPAPEGYIVKFAVGDALLQGTVEAVISREARALVSVRTSQTETQNFRVNAEDVKSHRKGIPSSPNGAPPTGGTPIAPRGGAILKEARVA